MKILHVFDHSIPIQDGYAYRSLNIIREQRELGWQTEHVTSAKQGKTAAATEDVESLTFYRTPPCTAWFTRVPLIEPWAVVATLKTRLAELLSQLHPDIVHAHSPLLNGLAALGVARRFGIPVVYEVRAFWEDAAVDNGSCREGGLRYRATRALETYVLRRAHAVTCICEGLRGDILARGLPAGKVTVIPNGVDPGQFAQDTRPNLDTARRLGLTPGRTIGFVGSFYHYEGLSLLLDALPAIQSRVPQIRLLLVGGGEQEGALRDKARRLGLGSRVIFTGRVPHAEVQGYYDLIDIVIYPRLSLRITELVTPLKPLEAMAHGRLIVASDVGGHRELIEDGRTGVLFKAGDPNDLAAKVVGLITEVDTAAVLRRAGREYVERERTWARSVAGYHDVYTSASARAVD